MAQHEVGSFPTQHPQSSVPQGLAVSPAPPVAEERLWLWAVALGDVPLRCARSHLSIGQSQAVHQWGWFAPAAQTSAREGGGGDTALLGPAQLTEAARWDTGREERKEGDPSTARLQEFRQGRGSRDSLCSVLLLGHRKWASCCFEGISEVSGQASKRHHVTSQAQRENPASSAALPKTSLGLSMRTLYPLLRSHAPRESWLTII